MAREVECCEQIASQLAIAWSLPPEHVFIDPATSDQPEHTFAVLEPAIAFEPGNGCNDSASLMVVIGGRFVLPTGSNALDMMRARAEKNNLARQALCYSAAVNPDVPRIGDQPHVAEYEIAEPSDIEPGIYKVLLTFTTTFRVSRGPFVAPPSVAPT